MDAGTEPKEIESIKYISVCHSLEETFLISPFGWLSLVYWALAGIDKSSVAGIIIGFGCMHLSQPLAIQGESLYILYGWVDSSDGDGGCAGVHLTALPANLCRKRN